MVNYPTVLIIFTLLLAGCANSQPGQGIAVKAAAPEIDVSAHKPVIEVQGPMTVARSELPDGKKLGVSLVEGRYFEDWITPGPFMGKNWEGEFRLQWFDESGNELHGISLNSSFRDESLTFNREFQIHTDDYNGDGDLDFVIGQYASSNGYTYRMFTLNQAERCIQELGLQPASELFISSGEGTYSIPLEKTGTDSFRIGYYDNSKGVQVESVYKWEKDRFIKQ
ncbi:hypothetical protein [Paenibacillus puerhi]|uniref:hypothetical protein n=1 Tax=Paenibacillus puerhi TaxID=2692622 RepID=UPI00135A41C7|nr:hypothetical protein [Paenibacillus puerhi]